MTRSPRLSWSALVWWAGVTTLSSGCHREKHAIVRLSTAEHLAIVHEVDSLYQFEVERDTVMVNDATFQGPVVDDGSIPHMTIATAELKPGMAQPAHRIIARIRSDAPYLNMGIQPGYNYVWRNSWSDADTASWLTRVISRDSATAYDLVRDARRQEYSHGKSAKEPRLVILKVHSVALAMCLDDPMCPTGHCGYY